MRNLADRVYLDANVFIYAALDAGSKGEKAREILGGIVKGNEVGFICSLAVDEVVWKIWKETKDRKQSIAQGLRILALPNIRCAPVTKEDMAMALGLMEENDSLKPRDAIHFSVCIRNNLRTIVSDDADFDELKGLKRIGLA